MRRKVFVLLLTLSLVLSFMPVIAFADTEAESESVNETVEADMVESEEPTQDSAEALTTLSSDTGDEKCEHKNTYKVVEWDWDSDDIEYSKTGDNQYHKAKCPVFITLWCLDCGKKDVGHYKEVREDEFMHYYDSNHVCSRCHHKNTCKHDHTEISYDWIPGINDNDCTPENNRYHRVTGPGTKITKCTDCGEIIKREDVDNINITELHEYGSNHECWRCGHKNTCTHPSKYNKYDYDKDNCTIVDIGDGIHHKATGYIYVLTYCEECEELLGTEEHRDYTITDSHSFRHNTCRHCGYKKTSECNHVFDAGIVTAEPSCTETGVRTYTCKKCKAVKTEEIAALGHDWSDPVWTWADDHSSASAKFTCKNDGTHVETINAKVTSAADATGDNTVYTAKATFNGKEYKDTVTEGKQPQKSDERLYGKARYDTAIKAADENKAITGSKFENVIVAYGQNFPDALAGGYLAKVKNAPILLVESSEEGRIADYISKNITSGGKVYILGGTGVVSSGFEKKVKDKKIKTERLGGQTRYETNIKILEEAGVKNEDVLVCTGNGYADSLSASAVGKPILLVGNTLTNDQKKYIKSLNTKQFYLIGGEGVVGKRIQTDLNNLGDYDIKRLWGQSRYETSTEVAKMFFPKAKTVVLAYAQNFPDGLSGGPLAMLENAPIVLTDSNKTDAAKVYVKESGAAKNITLGGPALISDKAVKAIMGR